MGRRGCAHPRSCLDGDLLRALGAAGDIAAPGHNVQLTDENGSFQVGDIVVEPVDVDHDIPGCAGFIARTPTGTVAYTGDWRYHGNAPKLIDVFVERCRQADVNVLMTEGSTLITGRARPECSEQEVAERFDALLATATGLVTVTPAGRNVERISAFARAAAAHGRRLALSPATARILWESNRLGLETSVDDVGMTALALEGELEGLPEAWDLVQTEDVAADRSAFVCEISPERWHLWLDLRAGPGDLHVHSNGSPYGQGDPLWQVLETWVGQLGFGLEVLDSHGHAFPRDLEWLAREVAPRVVIPVHSNHPSSFPVGNYRLVHPGRGETIALHD